jgi:hypothetical protein
MVPELATWPMASPTCSNAMQNAINKDSHCRLFATEPQPGIVTRGSLLDAAVPIIP